MHTPAASPAPGSTVASVEIRDAELRYGSRERPVWSGLSLQVRPGEFLAVLGGNGSGKTSLLRCLLGLHEPSLGTVRVEGLAPRDARGLTGYIPQQRRVDPLTPLRARDLVGFGIDGDRWGVPGLRRSGPGAPRRRDRIQAALDAVGAGAYADRPVAALSGGEQQLLRLAQALSGDPRLLLCDEPLLSLDLKRQQAITAVINRRRVEHATAVVFVTHEINPVLPYVDRVLYLAGGRFRIGTVDEVLNPATLSELYQTPVDVFRAHGRIIVVGAPGLSTEPHASSHGGHP